MYSKVCWDFAGKGLSPHDLRGYGYRENYFQTFQILLTYLDFYVFKPNTLAWVLEDWDSNNFPRNNLQSIPVVSWLKYSFWNYLFWKSFFSPLWTFKFVCGAYSKAFPILEERGFSMTNMANLEVTILSVFMADRATYTHMQNTCHGAKWCNAFSQFTSPQVPTFYRLLHPCSPPFYTNGSILHSFFLLFFFT